jgi:hypothetical protein
MAFDGAARHYYPLFQSGAPCVNPSQQAFEPLNEAALEGPDVEQHIGFSQANLSRGNSDGSDNDLEGSPSGDLEVDFIANKRPRGRGFQYLVKWRGFPLDQATWEAASMLQNCQEKIQDYEKAESSVIVTDVNSSLPQPQPSQGRQTQLPLLARVLPPRVAAARTSDHTVITDVRKSTEEVLQSYQSKLVQVLLDNFDSRLPLPAVIDRISKYLDFTKMPLGESALDEDPLVTYGEQSLTWLVRSKLPHLDLHSTVMEYLAVKLYVREHKDKFMAKVEGTEARCVRCLLPTTFNCVLLPHH